MKVMIIEEKIINVCFLNRMYYIKDFVIIFNIWISDDKFEKVIIWGFFY